MGVVLFLLLVAVSVGAAVYLIWSAPVDPEAAARERARRGRARAHSLGRRGDPNDLAPWDRL